MRYLILILCSVVLLGGCSDEKSSSSKDSTAPDSVVTDSTELIKKRAVVVTDSAFRARYHDTTVVAVRKPGSHAFDEYLNDKDFIYDREPPPTISWWDRFWYWFWQKVAEFFGSSYGGAFGTMIKWLLIAAAVGGIVWLIAKGTGTGFFYRRSKRIIIPSTELEENIHEINFMQRINEAIENGNYRRAIRLMYLRELKRLSDSGLIHWHPSKTNSAYERELSKTEYAQLFARITFLFNHVWYGNVMPQAEEFHELRRDFDEFAGISLKNTSQASEVILS